MALNISIGKTVSQDPLRPPIPVPSPTSLEKRHQNLSLNDFYARMKGDFGEDFAKTSRYYVKFSRNLSFDQELSYLCDAAEFPGRGFTSEVIRYYGPAYKIPVATEYEDLTLSIMVRDYWRERAYFDNWMNQINPINNFNFDYRQNYVCKIEVFPIMELGDPNDLNQPVPGAKGRAEGVPDARLQGVVYPIDTQTQELKTLNREANPNYVSQYKFVFEDAWPIVVQPTPVTWSDDNIYRISVQLAFKRWHVVSDDTKPEPIIGGESSETNLLSNALFGI